MFGIHLPHRAPKQIRSFEWLSSELICILQSCQFLHHCRSLNHHISHLITATIANSCILSYPIASSSAIENMYLFVYPLLIQAITPAHSNQSHSSCPRRLYLKFPLLNFPAPPSLFSIASKLIMCRSLIPKSIRKTQHLLTALLK